MYTKFPCPKCGKNLKVSEEHFGQRVRCPHCKNAVQVPEAQPAEQTVDWSSIVSSPSTAQRPEKPPSGPRVAANRFTGGTDVNPLWSALFGVLATIITLALLYPIRNYYLGAVIINRGWVPYVETVLFFWAMAHLVMKWRKVRQQRDAILYDLLPTEISEDITSENVDRFLDHVRTLAKDAPQSILVNRVLRGLDHFKVRQSSSEVSSVLSSQSDIDANAVGSSYTLIKVCNWAIPILGFIGTVIGIGQAVSGLGGDAANLDAIKEQLGTITTGLGVAFDTTLVALVMSLIITFPASSMQKSEEDLLNQVDDYCNENLLLRLRESTATPSPVPRTNGAVDPASVLATQQALLKSADEAIKGLLEQFGRHLALLTEKVEATDRSLTSALVQSAAASRQQLAAMDKGLARLSDTLVKLGGERLVVEVQPARGGLFSWWRRSNGVTREST